MKKLISRLIVALMAGAFTFVASASKETYDDYAAKGTITYDGKELTPSSKTGWLRDAINLGETGYSQTSLGGFSYEGATITATSDGVVRHAQGGTYAHFWCDMTYDVTGRTVIGASYNGFPEYWLSTIFVSNRTGRASMRVTVLADEKTRLGAFEYYPETGAQIVCDRPVKIIQAEPGTTVPCDWTNGIPHYGVAWYYADKNAPGHEPVFNNDGMYYYSQAYPVSLKGTSFDKMGYVIADYDFTVPHTSFVVMDNGKATPEWEGGDFYGCTNECYGTTKKFQIAYRAHPTEGVYTTDPGYYFPDGTTNRSVTVNTPKDSVSDTDTFPVFGNCYTPAEKVTDTPVPLIPVDADSVDAPNATWTINGILVKEKENKSWVLSNGVYTVTYKADPGYCFEGAKTEITYELDTTVNPVTVKGGKKPDDPVVAPTVITIDADAEADGTNTFKTLDAAFQAPLTQCATNLVLTGGIVTLSADVPADTATNNLQVITGSGYLLIDEKHADAAGASDAEALAANLQALVAEGSGIKVRTAANNYVVRDEDVLWTDVAALQSIKLPNRSWISGDVELIAPTTTITGTLAWDIADPMSSPVTLENFDDITEVTATYAIGLGTDIATNTYTLATKASNLDGQTFTFLTNKTAYASLTVGKGGDVVYNGQVYTLAMDGTSLTMTVDGDYIPAQLAAVDTAIANAYTNMYAMGLSEEEASYSADTLETISSTAKAAINVATNKAAIDEALTAEAASITEALKSAKALADAPARIASTPYDTVADAVKAAAAGDTVILRKNVKTDTVSVDKDLTFDLGTNTLSAAEGTPALDVTGGTVQLTGTTGSAITSIRVALPGEVVSTTEPTVAAPEGYEWFNNGTIYTLVRTTAAFTGDMTIATNLTADATWVMTIENANITVDKIAGTDTLASITNNLIAIQGTGKIFLNAKAPEYREYLRSLRTAESEETLSIDCLSVEAKATEQVVEGVTLTNLTAVVEASVEDPDAETTLVGAMKTDGDVLIQVKDDATKDVVVNEGAETSKDMTIINESTTQSLTVPEAKAENVTIKNYGHLESDTAAKKDLNIFNGSANTLVGTYKAGGAINVTGAYGSLSNVVIDATGTLTLKEKNIISGPVTMSADSFDVSNNTLLFSVVNNNTTLDIDFDYVSESKSFGVIVDKSMASGTYPLATDAAKADGKSFTLYKGIDDKAGDMDVGGSNNPIYNGGSYAVVLEGTALKLTVDADYVSGALAALASMTNTATATIDALRILTTDKNNGKGKLGGISFVQETVINDATDTDTIAAALANAESLIEQTLNAAKTLEGKMPTDITIDANAAQDGTNTFNTLDAAFKASLTPCATNLVLTGGIVSLSTGVFADASPDPATNNLQVITGSGYLLIDENHKNAAGNPDAEALAAALDALVAEDADIRVCKATQTINETDKTLTGDLAAFESITLDGKTTIAGDVELIAPKTTVTGTPKGTLSWDVSAEASLLRDFDYLTEVNAEYAIDIKSVTATPGVVTNRTLATKATKLSCETFKFYTTDADYYAELTVGEEGDVVYNGMVYTLAMTNGTDLVLTMDGDYVSEQLGYVSGAVEAAIAQVNAMRLTPGEREELIGRLEAIYSTAKSRVDDAKNKAGVAAAIASVGVEGTIASILADAAAIEANKPGDITIDATIENPDGTNTFNTLDAAFSNTEFMPCATNLIVTGTVGLTAGVLASPATNCLQVITGPGAVVIDAAHKDANGNSDAAALEAFFKSIAGEGVTVTTAEKTETRTDATLEGAVYAAEAITLGGTSTITGDVKLVAPSVTNNGTLDWDLTGDNTEATLADFDCITEGPKAAFAITLDDAQTSDENTYSYTIATGAASATNLTFTLNGPAVIDGQTLTVGGDMLIVGTKAYTLSVGAGGSLVLKIEFRMFYFGETAYTVTEGGAVIVKVNGGSPLVASQATLNYVRGTGAFTAAYMGGKRVTFPLTLTWAKGDTAAKEIVFTTTANRSATGDTFFTLQLGSPVGIDLAEAKSVCTVTIKDAQGGTATDYVRALPWPANGGKVTGSNYLRNERAKVNLVATANKWATFAGWYPAKADDAEQIDLTQPIDPTNPKLPTRLTVGYGTDLSAGTYYAYFTNVMDVASVVEPTPFDETGAACEGVVGVTGWDSERGVYATMVGVKFSLPITFDACGDTKATLTAKGLPAGINLSKDKVTGAYAIGGVPTRAGTFAVTLTAKNQAGQSAIGYTLVVEALPENAIGTFYGVIRDDEAKSGIGNVILTASKVGSLSAKVTRREAGTRSFSAKGYTILDENTLGVAVTNANGEVVEAVLPLTNDVFTTALVGAAFGGEKKGTLGYYGETNGTFAAYRNAAKAGDLTAKQVAYAYAGTYASMLYAAGEEVGTVSFRVNANGGVTTVAKYAKSVDPVTGKAIAAKSISGSADGAFGYDGEDKVGIVQLCLRSGTSTFGADARLDMGTRGVEGEARYIRLSTDKATVLDEFEAIGSGTDE